MTVVHGLNVLDWDGDGRDEILTASFEGVHLFHSAGSGADLTWTRTHLGAGDQQSSPKRGASEIGVGKVAGKRFLATIEPWHGDQVVVYSEALPGELWTRQVIDPNFHEGHALACADLDGDGNDEIVAGFRGPGTSLYVYYAADSSGLNWQRQLHRCGNGHLRPGHQRHQRRRPLGHRRHRLLHGECEVVRESVRVTRDTGHGSPRSADLFGRSAAFPLISEEPQTKGKNRGLIEQVRGTISSGLSVG